MYENPRLVISFHRVESQLVLFQDSWPRLEKWFSKYGSLVTVDAAQGEETVYLEVERILEETLHKVRSSVGAACILRRVLWTNEE